MLIKVHKFLRKSIGPYLRRLKYFGRSRFCPICERSSSRFEPFGIICRNDAQCPFCGSLERHRLFWLYLFRKTEFKSSFSRGMPYRMLHVAPEKMLEQRFRKVFGKNYLTADLFSDNVDVKMDITNIQYPDASFDFIYCSHVLEHVPDDRKAMREFFRVLSSKGTAILLVPITSNHTFEDPSITDPQERLRLFGQEDHVRCYGHDYLFRLIEAGFKVEVTKPEDFLTTSEIQMMGITSEAGEIFSCRRDTPGPE